MRVATDVGGTFTDLVVFEKTAAATPQIRTTKVSTTPPDYARGIAEVIAKSKLLTATIDTFVHGTTVVVNALTERKGVKTGLITSAGFRDVVEIARGNRPDVFNFMFRKPTPFVPRHLRAELDERLDHRGRVLRPLDLAGLPPILDRFRAEGVEGIAVCFLHAYLDPRHEQEVVGAIRRLWPEVSVIASHEVSREWREYERFNTAALAAYVHPIVSRYLHSLERSLTEDGFTGTASVMQSNGGIASFAEARRNPIAMVESGPASGVLGAAALGQLIGTPDLISLDVGGTTAKCSLIAGGQPRIITDYMFEATRASPGHPIKVPVIDIVEIGAGGGSVAWLDPGGKLRVGPKSAGAMPGPVAYGRGGEAPTLTDAHLLTGRIDPDYFLGGEIVPDLAAARHAFTRLGQAMGVGADDAARGVIRIANAGMVNALELISVNRGHDPRDFALIAFGGGGGLHAATLARELDLPQVIIPVHPAVFSAWAMLQSDMRRDYLRTRLVPLEDETATATCNELFTQMEREAWHDFAGDGVASERIVFQRFADLRYADQEFTVKVACPGGPITAPALAAVREDFHAAHEREFTFRLEGPAVIVNFHLVATGQVDKPEIPRLTEVAGARVPARRGVRRVDLDADGVHDVPIYDRSGLAPGMAISGPAIVEEPDTTVLVLPDQRLEPDAFGNLVLDPNPRRARRSP